MPIQSTSIDNNTGDGFDYTANSQTFLIMTGVAVVSEQAQGAGTSFNNDKLINYGTLVGSTYGIIDNFDDAADRNFSGQSTYINESSGLITASTAIKIETENDTIDNYGHIEGVAYGIDALLYAVGATISNYGAIDSDGTAVGVIDTASIFNSGTINGGDVGIRDYGLNGSTTIVNSGVIAAGVSGSGDAIFGNGNGGTIKVTNTGTIEGNVDVASLPKSTIVNKGSIEGDVQLGNGPNTFNGVGGTVTGTITGGSGADTIRLGNDGETVNGGAGHDMIYGGAGADTFDFTSVLAVDTDKIVGFNVAADTIQLDHTEFVGLIAGATPVFSIGAAPTSASDHLYYNSTTGWLYYDADGTGSKPSHGFANVGAGLHLTAKDFTVV